MQEKPGEARALLGRSEASAARGVPAVSAASAIDRGGQRGRVSSGNKRQYPDPAAKRAALDELGPAPVGPLHPMLVCPEPTFEGLERLFAIGQPSMGVFSGEGGQFVGGHGMQKEAKLRTAAALSGLWDGEAIRRVRALDGATLLPGRRLSLHLMVQPDVANFLLCDRLLADQGLLSRLLVTAPASAAGTRAWKEAPAEADLAIRRYGARLLTLLEEPLPLAPGRLNELTPRPRLRCRGAPDVDGLLRPCRARGGVGRQS